MDKKYDDEFCGESLKRIADAYRRDPEAGESWIKKRWRRQD